MKRNLFFSDKIVRKRNTLIWYLRLFSWGVKIQWARSGDVIGHDFLLLDSNWVTTWLESDIKVHKSHTNLVSKTSIKIKSPKNLFLTILSGKKKFRFISVSIQFHLSFAADFISFTNYEAVLTRFWLNFDHIWPVFRPFLTI